MWAVEVHERVFSGIEADSSYVGDTESMEAGSKVEILTEILGVIIVISELRFPAMRADTVDVMSLVKLSLSGSLVRGI